MAKVSFIWTGAPGVYSKRTLTGDVLEQRARRDGGTDFLVKSPELNLAKWVNAEFCEVVPEVVITVQKPEPVTSYVPNSRRQGLLPRQRNDEAHDVDTRSPEAVIEQFVTVCGWLISQASELARAAGVNAAIALETIVVEWAGEQKYNAAVSYYTTAMQSEVARQRLYCAVESKAAVAAVASASTAA